VNDAEKLEEWSAANGARDWTRDGAQYSMFHHTCNMCQMRFNGHRNRKVCRTCDRRKTKEAD
jgi:hypothetical protein